MKPKDLVVHRLQEHIVERLEARGFRFSAAKPSFSRKQGHANQRINFALSRWNREDDASFWTLWGVTSTDYVKWHAAQWGDKPLNDALGGSSDWNIPGWTRGPAAEYFRLTNSVADAAEMAEFARNIEGAGLAFLETISNWESAAERLRSERWMFDRAVDFLMIAGQRERARAVLLEGIQTFEVQRRPDNFQELPRLRARLERYFSTAHDETT